MARSKKDGANGGGHRRKDGKEYWKSRLHRGGETPGRATKRFTHGAERRAGKAEVIARVSEDEENQAIDLLLAAAARSTPGRAPDA